MLRTAGSDRNETCASNQEGHRLVGLLQSFLVNQSEEIEALNKRIKSLVDERNELKIEGNSGVDVKWQDATTQTEGTCNCDTSFHGEVSQSE